MTRETDIVGRIIAHLKKKPRCHALKVWGGPYGHAGEPDVDGCIEGRSLKIEVKVPGKRPTPLQIRALQRWEAAGALAGWVTSVEEVEELLTHLRDPEWRNPQLAQ